MEGIKRVPWNTSLIRLLQKGLKVRTSAGVYFFAAAEPSSSEKSIPGMHSDGGGVGTGRLKLTIPGLNPGGRVK